MTNRSAVVESGDAIKALPLWRYFFIAYLLSWSVSVPLLLSVRGIIDVSLAHELEMLAAMGPLLAAIYIAKRYGGSAALKQLFESCLHWRVGAFWTAFSVLSPFVLLLGGVVFLSLGGGQIIDLDTKGVAQILTMAGLFKLLIATSLVQSLGEEPGWRGIAIPILRSRFGPLTASLMLFPIWLCWHLPQFLARPEFGLAQLIGFSVGILSATIWLTLLWDKTHSVLMVFLWHALINIARNIGLAVSPSLFMTMNTGVLLGAIAIVIYWWRSKQS
ncbi:MAG: membrane protease YdiL (CAAX protease family) [Oceanicoccus sp.]|jgi:membrane protease YdiL (CAAX protease family)